MLISVICLCHNHAPYVKEAIFSVLQQSYRPIELIVVDDASTDGSKEIIREIINKNPEIQFINIAKNVGNCKAFNLGFKLSKGEYILDLAADDVFIFDRIKKQIEEFKNIDPTYGVVYSDALYIDEFGNPIRKHADRFKYQPSGDIYQDLVEKYFICPPTMMIKREVLETLGGYDETLTYEDFDFWVRSSRIYKYHYLNEITTKKRELANSHGSKFLSKANKIHDSTFAICKKIAELNRNEREAKALAKRIFTEIKLGFLTENFDLVGKYAILFRKLEASPKLFRWQISVFEILAKLKIRVFWVYRLML